jgi:hypothetical protein
MAAFDEEAGVLKAPCGVHAKHKTGGDKCSKWKSKPPLHVPVSPPLEAKLYVDFPF